jgi:hypothetical protein
MAESSPQEPESPEQKKSKDISGLVFVGCVVIGMGISFATGTMPVGLFIGIGVGFIMMALIRHRSRS